MPEQQHALCVCVCVCVCERLLIGPIDRKHNPTTLLAQFAKGKGEADKERVKALRQQAKDFAILLKNLDRQKVRASKRAPD
jgi:hypothetical protein